MSFIKKTEANAKFINLKITSKGREMMSRGKLNFSSFSVGDSEFDYNSDISNTMIQKPHDMAMDIKDKLMDNRNIDTFKIGSNGFSEIIAKEDVTTKGFFTRVTNSDYFDVKPTYFKSIKRASLTSKNTLLIDPISDTTNMSVNDYLCIRFSNSDLELNLADSQKFKNFTAIDQATPFLIYKIKNIDTLLGVVTLDRDVVLTFASNYIDTKKFTIFIIPKDSEIINFYNALNTNEYPIWKYATITKDTKIGLDESIYKNFLTYYGRNFDGFFQFMDVLQKDRIGVLYYDDNTNTYGESLFKDSIKIQFPTLFYHYENLIGVKIKCDTKEKILQFKKTATKYYDLILESNVNFVVGKCFPDLKLCIFEEPELIEIISYKSNRNFSLPEIKFSTKPTTTTNQIFETSEKDYDFWFTYMFENDSYITGTPNTYLKKIPYSESISLLVNFDKLDDFKFMNLSGGMGFKTKKIYLIWQKVKKTEKPKSNLWKFYELTNLPTTPPSDEKAKIYTGDFVDATKLTQNGGYIFVVIKDKLTNSTNFNLNTFINSPEISSGEGLEFYTETIPFANIFAKKEARIYQTSLICNLKNISKSQNKTWGVGRNYVYISEVNVYDNENNLIFTGKFSMPFKKLLNENKVVYLNFDF